VTYPKVADEWATLTRLHLGFSIARGGDGELKTMDGASYVRQDGSQKLAAELREVFTNPHPRCIVGIPTMNPHGPKFPKWDRHRGRFERLLEGTKVERYYSAFISRPDSAPWIREPAFAMAMQQLWSGKRVAVLCEPENSMLRVLGLSASNIDHVKCPTFQAYGHIDHFERQLMRNGPDLIVMACGPTATCLANRFARHGIQALDLGSAGGFLLKLLS